MSKGIRWPRAFLPGMGVDAPRTRKRAKPKPPKSKYKIPKSKYPSVKAAEEK